LGVGARRITISTCGVVPKILKLAEEGLQIELSVSLHGARDDVRKELMPVNRRWPLAELLPACDVYVAKTKREITFEYILAEGLNAAPSDAEELAFLLKERRCTVNLIPLNPIPEFPYKRPVRGAIDRFAAILRQHGIRTTVRFSSGTDINAACGQLRSVELAKKREENA
jgi:23S rRNA (adenine2503-C2)-methyltransferase